MIHRYIVIMAGGYGNMFWPASRDNRPKQFLDISGGGKSYIRATYENCLGIVPQDNILVITLDKYRHFISEQLPEVRESNILSEPYSRKTATAVAFATYSLIRRDPEAVAAMVPADTIITNSAVFKDNLSKTFEYAAGHSVLMTLGVKPEYPDSNYGYIQVAPGEDKVAKVKTFTEKPPMQLAEVFCQSGEFFWNSGIFVWQCQVIREEMERYMPELVGLFDGWEYALGSPVERVFLEKVYSGSIKISIDCAVMEKTSRAMMFRADFDWCDLDSWEALYNHSPKDTDGNLINCSRSHLEDSSGNIIISDRKDKLAAVKGLKDFIIVDTEDILLICPRNDKAFRELQASAGAVS